MTLADLVELAPAEGVTYTVDRSGLVSVKQSDGLFLAHKHAEAKNIAAGYGNATASEHVFKTFLREVIKPRISRDLNPKELDDLAASLAWENSIYDPTLTLDEYLTRLELLNPALARTLRS